MSNTQQQLTIFDALGVLDKRYENLIGIQKKISKKTYQNSFIELNKSFLDDKITVDEYKDSLHILLEQYRKDYKNGYAKTTK